MSDKPSALQTLVLVLRELGRPVTMPKKFVLDGDEGFGVFDNGDGTMTVRYLRNREEFHSYESSSLTQDAH